MTTTRRLAAILAADMVGYSRLMGMDEEGTLARLHALQREVIDPCVAASGGRVVKSTGDGILTEFPSAVEAVRCALAMQVQTRAHEDGRSAGERIEFRIGINVGDVIVSEGDIHGDGVNVAARLEALAEPGGILVSAIVQETAGGRLDCRFEDIGEQDLKNIARKVRAFRVAIGEPERQALALPDKPSLVVLPFQNMSGDPEQEYFVDGLVEDVTTALARTGWLFVIARNSAFTYKGRAVDVRQVGRELGVRYVLEGSVRRAGGRVRITCQLIEATTGGHIWADRFEGDHADIFDLQDRVTESVVGAIEPNLQRVEIARASAKPTENLDAYDIYLKALQQFNLLTAHGNREAMQLLRQAISMDTKFGLAAALTACCVAFGVEQEWIARSGPDPIEAIALARSALENSPDDPSALRLAGLALAYLARDLDAGQAALDRAIALNANSAQILGSSGWVRNFRGDFDVARDRFTRAMRLSPLDPEMYVFQNGLAQALILGEPSEPERGLDLVEKSLVVRPNWRSALVARISCLVKLGRLDEAKERAREFLRAEPHFTLSESRRTSPYRSHVADKITDLRRRAGFPE